MKVQLGYIIFWQLFWQMTVERFHLLAMALCWGLLSEQLRKRFHFLPLVFQVQTVNTTNHNPSLLLSMPSLSVLSASLHSLRLECATVSPPSHPITTCCPTPQAISKILESHSRFLAVRTRVIISHLYSLLHVLFSLAGMSKCWPHAENVSMWVVVCTNYPECLYVQMETCHYFTYPS